MKKLNKIEFAQVVVGLFLVTALSSCGKVDDQLNSSVTIKMPDLSDNSLQSVSALMTSSVSQPTSLSEINCFAVMVGGPAGEPNLNRTRCEIVTVTSVSGTEIETVIGNRQVGMIRGLVKKNETITLEVPSGNDRVFTLVGFKASPETSCLSFTDPNINLDLTSKPIILGTTAGVNLTGGGVINTVNIQMQSASGSIVNNNRIGDCYGPDNPGTSKIVPTRAILTKNYFPTNALVAGECNSVNVEFVDNLGRIGEIPVSASVSLSNTSYDASGAIIGSNPTYTLFNDKEDCSSLINQTGFINIEEKEKSKQIWFRAASGTVNTQKFQPSITSSATINLPGIEKTFLNYSNTNPIVSFNFFGPRRVLADTCYKMSAYIVSTSGSAITSATPYRYKVEHLLANGSQDIGASFYYGNINDGDYICNESNRIDHGASSTALIGDNSINDRPYFFVKYSSSLPYRQTSLGLTPLVSGSVSSTLVRGILPFEVVTGTAIPARLFIEGPNQIKNNTCDYYYQVQIANTLGAAVPASSTITLTTTSISGGGQLFVGMGHNNCPGSTSPVSGTTSFTTKQYSRDFRLKATGVSASSVFRVTATASVSGTVSGSIQLQPSYFDITVTGP